MNNQNLTLDEINLHVTPKSLIALTSSLVKTFGRIQSAMNPSKIINRKRMLRCMHFDINEYIPPSRIFDVKRLLDKNPLKKNKKRGNKYPVKMKPLKGFKDPLQLRRKCSLKISKCPEQPFVLLNEGQYVPPPSRVPPYILNSERIFPNILAYSPSKAETIEFGKYRRPISLKPKIKRKPFVSQMILEEFAQDIYHAPLGSKENYSCKSLPEMTAALKALKEVSVVLPNNNLYQGFQQKNYEISKSASQENIDFEYTNLHTTVSNFLFSDTDSEADVFHCAVSQVKVLQMENQIKGEVETTECESMKMNQDEILQSNSEMSNNLVYEYVDMNKNKPHMIRKKFRESTSVSKLINDNLMNTDLFEENQLDVYKPPSYQELTLTESSSTSKLRLNTPSIKEFYAKSKSCCDLSSTTKSTCLQSTKNLESISRRPSIVGDLSFKNSVDEILKLRQMNPIGFCVLRTMCTKKLSSYTDNNNSSSSGHCGDKVQIEEEDFPNQNIFPESKEVAKLYGKRNDVLKTWWRKYGKYLKASDELDQGYLGSEEDEEYKVNMLNDYWPIPDQFTDQFNETYCHSSDSEDKNDLPPEPPMEKENALIDYDDQEHWNNLSVYEELFSQFPYNGKSSFPPLTLETRKNGSKGKRHFISKFLSYCKNGFLKNL